MPSVYQLSGVCSGHEPQQGCNFLVLWLKSLGQNEMLQAIYSCPLKTEVCCLFSPTVRFSNTNLIMNYHQAEFSIPHTSSHQWSRAGARALRTQCCHATLLGVTLNYATKQKRIRYCSAGGPHLLYCLSPALILMPIWNKAPIQVTAFAEIHLLFSPPLPLL